MIPHHHLFEYDTASARFEAWWLGEKTDRPPVSLHVETAPSPRLPKSNHNSLRERWLDVDFQVDSALARLESTQHFGDSVPCWMPNVGPDLVSTLFGAELEFGETTSWCQTTIHEPEDWAQFLEIQPDFDNIYWRTIEMMIKRAAKRFANEYYIAMPDLHGSFDILSGLRGAEDLCYDLIDDPEPVRQASLHASRVYVSAYNRLDPQLTALVQPRTTWTNYLHDGPAYVPSCDFWCLVSGQIARDLVVPTIELEMTPFERSIFHLDGPQALHHLDLVLALPGLNAVQWVYGAGQGRASDWLDVYRQCRQAGKSVQILAQDTDDALNVLRELGPDGLWLTVCNPLPSADHAIEFLQTVNQLSA